MDLSRNSVRSFLVALILTATTLCLATGAVARSRIDTELNDQEQQFLAEGGPVVFISQTSYPPFEFIDPVTGARSGMMVELASWISTEFGFHAEFRDTNFMDAQKAIQAGSAHVLTSFFFSEARDRTFDFTQTVYEIPATLFVAADRPDITGLDDLAGKRIAIQRGDYAEHFLKEKGVGFVLVPTSSFEEASQAVLEGRADALIGDEQIVLHFLYRNNLNSLMKRVGEPLYVGQNSMAVIEGNHLLQSIIDKGIARARASGALERISAKWLGAPLQTQRIHWLSLWPYVLGALALTVLILLSNMRLRYVVRRKTDELTRHQARLEGIIEGTRAGTWQWDFVTGRLTTNATFSAMLGYGPDELAPIDLKRCRALSHSSDFRRARALMKAHLDGAVDHYTCEIRMRHKAGHWVWLLQRGKIIERAADGTPRQISGIQIDISATKESQFELQLTASVFANAREAIIITNADGEIVNVNTAFSRITGYSRAEAIGKKAQLLETEHNPDLNLTTFWQALHEKGVWEGEMYNRRKNGDIFPQLLTAAGVQDEDGHTSHFVAVFTDISRQKEYERKLEHLAYYDDLTGLPNRVMLVDRLGQAMARARRGNLQIGLAYLDLDGFKQINDTHGHDEGDRVLIEIANRLKRVLREEDTVARVGGDEFVIVLFDPPGGDRQQVLVRRVLDVISESIHFEESTYQVSGSIGLVHFVGETDLDSDQLIRQADQAMYQAKQSGKNRFHVFDAEQDRAVRGRHENIERIRRAIRHGELVLYYQPKVNLRDGTLVGAEALIRWVHPELGLLGPSTFLPDVENHRAGSELGDWVIDTALNQIAQWRTHGLDLPVSVNISANHLQQADFVDRLDALLKAHPDVPPKRLELEVLETSALEDIERVSSVLSACANLGVRFALDDFGTGYSSLTYLKRLPVNVLKIDQSFVRDMLHDPGDLSILEGVLGLARAFHREVIAEGVESVEHGKLLLQLGCDCAQGYAIARPMPAHGLMAWSRQWRAPEAWMNTGRLRREDIEMLYAAAEHRAWLQRLEHYALRATNERPEINAQGCRFGQWLSHMQENATTVPDLDRIQSLHEDIHALSHDIVDQVGRHDDDTMDALLERINQRSEDMLNHLHALIDDRSRYRGRAALPSP